MIYQIFSCIPTQARGNKLPRRNAAFGRKRLGRVSSDTRSFWLILADMNPKTAEGKALFATTWRISGRGDLLPRLKGESDSFGLGIKKGTKKDVIDL